MIRGIVISVIEGFIKLFSASGRSYETLTNREYMQHYGFTSRPKEGAEIIIINEGNHYLAIASDDRRYRLAVEDGEVALYTDEGDAVHLKRGNNIEVTCKNKLTANVTNEVDINTKVAKIAATTSADITSPVATVNASTSCTVTSPAVTVNGTATCVINSPVATINASTSCIINSPSVQLGGSSGTMRFLCDARLLQWLRDHTHSFGIKPQETLTDANVITSITKGGLIWILPSSSITRPAWA